MEWSINLGPPAAAASGDWPETMTFAINFLNMRNQLHISYCSLPQEQLNSFLGNLPRDV